MRSSELRRKSLSRCLCGLFESKKFREISGPTRDEAGVFTEEMIKLHVTVQNCIREVLSSNLNLNAAYPRLKLFVVVLGPSKQMLRVVPRLGWDRLLPDPLRLPVTRRYATLPETPTLRYTCRICCFVFGPNYTASHAAVRTSYPT